MTILVKGDIHRDVKESKVAGYLAAGWHQPGAKKQEKNLDLDAIRTKPTANATAAVIPAVGDNLDNQGD
jgi:hypothetical protein